MRLTATLTATVAVLVLCAGLAPGGDEDEPHFKHKQAQAAIVALSYRLDAPDVSERAKKIVAEHASEHISSIFAPPARGGLGVGKLLGENHRGGIQNLVAVWSSRPPSKEVLEANRADSLKVARAIRAMSELAPHRTPQNPTPARLKEWTEVAKEFKSAAIDFHRAVKGTEPAEVKAAARKLNNTCCHCHELVE